MDLGINYLQLLLILAKIVEFLTHFMWNSFWTG